MQAVNRAAETAINARSEVREAYAAYRTAYDLARHYRDEMVPLRKRISEENAAALQRHADRRVRAAGRCARRRWRASTPTIEAQRDFWLAEADLQMALIGTGPAWRPMPSAAPATAAEAGGAPAH